MTSPPEGPTPEAGEGTVPPWSEAAARLHVDPDPTEHTERSERIAGVILVLAGVAAAAEAMTFDVFFMVDPVGPKALPLLSAGIFVVTGVLLAARPTRGVVWPGRPKLLRMGGSIAAFLAYAGMLAPLGFFTATTAAVGALSTLFGAPPLRAFAAAAALATAMWFGFVFGLGLPLPIGELWTR